MVFEKCYPMFINFIGSQTRRSLYFGGPEVRYPGSEGGVESYQPLNQTDPIFKEKFSPVNVLDVIRLDVEVFGELVNEEGDGGWTYPFPRMDATVNKDCFVSRLPVGYS